MTTSAAPVLIRPGQGGDIREYAITFLAGDTTTGTVAHGLPFTPYVSIVTLTSAEQVPNAVQTFGTSPANNTPVLAPLDAESRDVSMIVTLTSAAAQIASVALQVESAPASGVYHTVARASCSPTGGVANGPIDSTLAAVVPGGCNYRFVMGGLAGTTETFATNYYTVDHYEAADVFVSLLDATNFTVQKTGATGSACTASLIIGRFPNPQNER